MRAETRYVRFALTGASTGAGAIVIVLLSATPSASREAISGQCGVDGSSLSYQIGSDGMMTATLLPSGKSRTARFRFFGGNDGTTRYAWDRYQYRYAVTESNFGPQSNEVVRFGPMRDDPRSGHTSEYRSPDSHNSNTWEFRPSPDVQLMDTRYKTPAGNTEIWTQAIFDIPGTPDKNCWTNAIATK